jgi:hypothetical protein
MNWRHEPEWTRDIVPLLRVVAAVAAMLTVVAAMSLALSAGPQAAVSGGRTTRVPASAGQRHGANDARRDAMQSRSAVNTGAV